MLRGAIDGNGFENNPGNINKNGAPKGPRWKTTLLRTIMESPVLNDDDKLFHELKEKFPSLFKSSEKANYQFFMMLRLMALVFDKDPKISLKAIETVIDRIDGKPKQSLDLTGEQILPVRYIDATSGE